MSRKGLACCSARRVPVIRIHACADILFDETERARLGLAADDDGDDDYGDD